MKNKDNIPETIKNQLIEKAKKADGQGIEVIGFSLANNPENGTPSIVIWYNCVSRSTKIQLIPIPEEQK